MLDYIIVGQGVAGSCFALKLLKEDKRFIIIDSNENQASAVAVGLYNPVVLKRFSLIWHAKIQLKWMFSYFQTFEELLNQHLIEELPVRRIFKNQDEIKTWQKKSKLPEISNYLNEKIFTVADQNIQSPFGYGEVSQTGRINLPKCMEMFRNYLTTNDLYRNEQFDYSKLNIYKNHISYQDLCAKHIVFCEGFSILNNPYFNYLPIIGVKGEVLKIKTDNPIPKAIWKAHNFLLPLEKNLCITASTYNREDLSYEPTENGCDEIMRFLEEFYKGRYEIVEQTAGIRPTVVDRRPILGAHPDYPNVFVLNGMGTRGTLLAPHMTEILFAHIEFGQEIDHEADIQRFKKFKR